MRVLLTTILCQSGLMTHVQDLVRYLHNNKVKVGVAFLKSNYATEAEQQQILSKISVPYWIYETKDQLRDITKEGEYNLLHGHSYLTFPGITFVGKELGIPVVVTLHSVYLWDLFYRKTLSNARCIIAVGLAQARSALAYNSKMTIIPNGIDTTVFKPAAIDEFLGRKEDKIRVLWYGRVNGKLSRGLQMLDQVAPQLSEHITLSALGTCDFRLKNIPHTNWTPDPVPYLQNAHLTFAHGRSLREAMACGSIGYMIGHGYGGHITEQVLMERDFIVDAFPQYKLQRPREKVLLHDILEVVRSPKINIMRRNAREIAEKYFDVNIMGSKTVEVYQEALYK